MDLKEMVLIALTEISEEAANARSSDREIGRSGDREIVSAAAIEPAIAPTIEEKPQEKIEEKTEQIAPSIVAPIAPSITPIAQNLDRADLPSENSAAIGSEVAFLAALRERILTLFEGFESPNNRAVEAKIDLTLNFFEYLLSAIDDRLEKLQN